MILYLAGRVHVFVEGGSLRKIKCVRLISCEHAAGRVVSREGVDCG